MILCGLIKFKNVDDETEPKLVLIINYYYNRHEDTIKMNVDRVYTVLNNQKKANFVTWNCPESSPVHRHKHRFVFLYNNQLIIVISNI